MFQTQQAAREAEIVWGVGGGRRERGEIIQDDIRALARVRPSRALETIIRTLAFILSEPESH